ncbi:hypothetical protein AB0K60_34750 [Thermopolyspora sp. NPDC052614]|uniref:hypothetical protein n=1 Tax=Thermopolyspora sp. NPDC052614 TaxID=3155682 RepID=UPI003443415C
MEKHGTGLVGDGGDAKGMGMHEQGGNPDLRPSRGTVTSEQFIENRRSIGLNAKHLIPKAIEHHGLAGRQVPLLTQPGWIPGAPLPLDRVHLELDIKPQNDLSQARRATSHYWPPVPGTTHPSYSQAVGEHHRPSRWYDGRSFRLMDVAPHGAAQNAEPAQQEVTLRFALGTYFDAYDTCEPLGYEAALSYARTSGQTIDGPYRQWLNDPFDLRNRCAVPGVNTLTIRRSDNETTFYLHERTGVATAMGTTHVVPAGEFQFSGQTAEPLDAELDLRSTIIREYVEEFLGAEDVLSPKLHKTAIDFSATRKYSPLVKAIAEGEAKIYYLGLGLYPLTWKPEILVVCVFEARLFDKVFRDMQREVYEGKIVGATPLKGFRYALRGRRGPYQGLRFDEETVSYHRDLPTTLPAGRACLALAWKYWEENKLPL